MFNRLSTWHPPLVIPTHIKFTNSQRRSMFTWTCRLILPKHDGRKLRTLAKPKYHGMDFKPPEYRMYGAGADIPVQVTIQEVGPRCHKCDSFSLGGDNNPTPMTKGYTCKCTDKKMGRLPQSMFGVCSSRNPEPEVKSITKQIKELEMSILQQQIALLESQLKGG